MALTITGFDANGRITPKGTNVVIPPESAGIADLIYKNGSTIKVIGRGTATSSSITINGVTYTLYGIIYGFAGGMAMVVAPQEQGNMQWGAYVYGMPTRGVGTVLMRNGLRTDYFAQMNTARNSNNITGGGSAPYQLSSANHATSLSSSTFDASASSEVKAHYGTWTEYIRQTLRVNGAADSPFGATATGVKVYEFGRWFGRTYGNSQYQASGTALRACYDYNEGGGTWWLPSMYELGELMIDEHNDKIDENIFLKPSPSDPNSHVVSVSSNRWSCVLCSSGNAWHYTNSGLSSCGGFGHELAVRPVTLLKII